MRNRAAWALIGLLCLSGPAGALVDLPENCYEKKQYPCAVRAERREKVSLETGSLVLSPGSGVSLLSSNQIQILDGQVWAEAQSPLTLSLWARTWVITGQALVQRKEKRIEVACYRGEIAVRGAFRHEVMVAGFENWWDPSTQGILKPFSEVQALQIWNRLTRPSADQVKEGIEIFREAWKGSLDQASDFYASIARERREVASLREEQEYQRKRALQNENQRLREMFRERHFSPYGSQ